MIGRTVAHYQVTAAIGASGMGEVYRATETKLGREVAIKVLPSEVATDPERLARFEGEVPRIAVSGVTEGLRLDLGYDVAPADAASLPCARCRARTRRCPPWSSSTTGSGSSGTRPAARGTRDELAVGWMTLEVLPRRLDDAGRAFDVETYGREPRKDGA